jgi:dTDP-3-amino-3,4,6-trideoxy-alpha-D-glucose transaminase
MIEIPFFGARRMLAEFRTAAEAALATVLDSGQAILGKELERFEESFASYCGAFHAVGVGNGLDAISLILCAIGVDAGSEVIVPGHTFIATWLAVTRIGARVVPVDIDLASYNIDPAAVANAITPRTKAIVAVHLYGRIADVDALSEIARRYNIALVEDAAQSHGAIHRGRRAGTLGIAAAFSFYPTKNLGAIGDGGMVTTDNRALAERIRRLRNYGSDRKHDHAEQGVNSRLDELQAAFLAARLPALDARNDRRRQIAARYTAELANLPGLVLPEAHSGLDHVWHLYVVRSPERDAIQGHLARAGIGTMVHYPVPPHRQAAYAGTVMAGAELPRTDLAAAQVLSLPLWPEMTDDEITHVVAQVRCAANELA